MGVEVKDAKISKVFSCGPEGTEGSRVVAANEARNFAGFEYSLCFFEDILIELLGELIDLVKTGF
jgi:hypothetical protein